MSLMKIRLPCSQRSVFADHAEFSDVCKTSALRVFTNCEKSEVALATRADFDLRSRGMLSTDARKTSPAPLKRRKFRDGRKDKCRQDAVSFEAQHTSTTPIAILTKTSMLNVPLRSRDRCDQEWSGKSTRRNRTLVSPSHRFRNAYRDVQGQSRRHRQTARECM